MRCLFWARKEAAIVKFEIILVAFRFYLYCFFFLFSLSFACVELFFNIISMLLMHEHNGSKLVHEAVVWGKSLKQFALNFNGMAGFEFKQNQKKVKNSWKYFNSLLVSKCVPWQEFICFWPTGKWIKNNKHVIRKMPEQTVKPTSKMLRMPWHTGAVNNVRSSHHCLPFIYLVFFARAQLSPEFKQPKKRQQNKP